MWKKIIVGILLSAVIGSGIYWFVYNKKLHTPVSNAINAIPTNAAIILESNQLSKTWEKLSQTNIIWEELVGSTHTFSKLNRQIHFLDSLIKTNHSIADLLENTAVFISAHLSGANAFDFLYVYSLPNVHEVNTVQDFIKSIDKKKKPTYRKYDGVDIVTIHPNEVDSINYVIYKGILMLSCKQSLIESGIRQINSGLSITNDKNFQKIINTAGKNVDANIYVNYKNMPSILNTVASNSSKNGVQKLSNFANFSGWDITLKPNAFLMSGFTQANDSANNFLKLFGNQKPQEIELTKIIPAKTALILFYGLSNVRSFQKEYQEHLVKKKYSSRYKTHIDLVNNKYNIDIEKDMLEWVDNEIALVITEPSVTSNYKENSYAVMHSNNIKGANQILQNLSETISKKEGQKQDNKNYRNHQISHLNLPNILPLLFGWQFDKITNNYYTTIEDYIVFGNSEEALQYFIFKYENNKTLGNDKNYQTFAENLSNEANLYLYSSIARSPDIYSSFVTNKYAHEIHNNLELFNKFEAIGMQFTSTSKLFYSNAYLKYNPSYKKESGTIWESKLDTTVSSKPFLVINHNTGAKEIFIQDNSNQIYLISNTGKIIWKKQLDEKIISDITQIDVYKNKKLQLLFNTKNAIHVIDRNGNTVKGFPIMLKFPATNPISVFDYNNNNNYRIFVADSSKNIICYNGHGEQIVDFKFEGSNHIINLPLNYFIVKNKDHLCAVDNKGEIYLFNRRGQKIIDLKEHLPESLPRYFIEKGKDHQNTFIVAADSIGNIIKVNLNNELEKINIQNFESPPQFDYQDLNNDKVEEYIFLTQNELKVFSINKALLFQYKFEEEVMSEPLIFRFPDGKGKIGVISKDKDEIYLFNDNGSIYPGFPYTGTTSFSIGDLNKEGLLNLVTGSLNNSIYVYQLE